MRIRTKKTLLRAATAVVVMSAAALVFLPAAVSSAQISHGLSAPAAATPIISSITAR